MTKEELSERLWDFAVRIGKVVDALPDTPLGRHVGGQLLRCGTSPAPNYDEACAAESPKDFVHKLAIVLKELKESRGWIRFIIKAELLTVKKMVDLEDEATQLCEAPTTKRLMVISSQNQSSRQKRMPTFVKHESICNLQFTICNLQWSSVFR